MELKPYPFCGGEPVKDCDPISGDPYIACGGVGCVKTPKRYWNSRPQNQKLIEALEEIVSWGQATSNAMGHANEPVDIAQQALDEVDNSE